LKKATRAVHAGTDRKRNMGGVNSPILTSSAIEYLDDSEVRYPRYFNTFNQQVVADKLCALENAEGGLVTSSGMAAISGIVLGLLNPGDHAVMLEGMYGGTHDLIVSELERLGIAYSLTCGDPSEIRSLLKPETRLIFIESPTNPLLRVVDLAAVAGIASEHGIVAAIDNTFATPILQNPLDLGFDLVMHSGTKYLGGHGDICCGAVVGRPDLIERIRDHSRKHGGSLNALDCYLLERSLKTLALRVTRQSENAARIASVLAEKRGIARVHYPGLEDHPDHETATRQMSGYGGMLSFELAAGIDPVAYLRALRLIPTMVSLGGVETIICQPVATSHAYMPEAERRRLGIGPRLLRLSVGIEDAEDLIEDLKQALGVAG
jgi:cystathionine beta-lyase/cystathionine gamma-synthase